MQLVVSDYKVNSIDELIKLIIDNIKDIDEIVVRAIGNLKLEFKLADRIVVYECDSSLDCNETFNRLFSILENFNIKISQIKVGDEDVRKSQFRFLSFVRDVIK